MKEELQDALVSIINTAVAATEFLAAEVPDVIVQLLTWKTWESAAVLTVMFIFLIPMLFSVYRNYLSVKIDRVEGDGSLLDSTIGWCIGNGMVFAIWVIIFCTEGVPHLLRIIQIQVAPKLYLIEYARSLV